MTDSRIAVILACHNRRAKTIACLDGLFRCVLPQGVALSVHLLDDASTDGTAEAVQAAHPSVSVVHGDGALFWNQGMIRAWQDALVRSPDFFLWLNDDTELHEDAIAAMWNTSSACSHQAIVVGSTSVSRDHRAPSYGGRDRSGGLLTPSDVAIPCHSFNGNCVLVPAAVHRRLGTLSPRYRHSFGDFDYGYRAARAGIARVVAPGYVGWCAPHDRAPKWSDPATPLRARFKAMYSPLGCPPAEQFQLDLVRSNLLVALFHLGTIHLRALVPRLWSHKERFAAPEKT